MSPEQKQELKSILIQLEIDLPSLTCAYSYNHNGSDYVCQFCHVRPVTNNDPIPHKDDCLGERLQKLLFEIDINEL